MSTLFDYGRFEDQKQSDEINEYFSLNVDPTARPLNINVDYWDAIYRVQQNIQDVLDGKTQQSKLNGLEAAYYKICKSIPYRRCDHVECMGSIHFPDTGNGTFDERESG